MNFFNSLQAVKTWFTGFTRPRKCAKRPVEECETINNKRVRMDNSLVEVVVMGNESLSEADLEITESGPSTTMSLRVSPPVMFISSEHHQRQIKSPVGALDLSDSEIKISQSSSLSSSQPIKSHQTVEMVQSGPILEVERFKASMVKGLHDSCSSMEGGFSALNGSNFTPKVDGIERLLPKIIKPYCFTLPARKFRETQEAVTKSLTTEKRKTPDEHFREKLGEINKITKIKPLKKKEIFPGYSQEKRDFIRNEISRSSKDIVFKRIRIKDLQTLYRNHGMLNDDLINHYIAMVVARDQQSLHMFNTFFYEKLSTYGYQSVGRLSKKKDIFACEKMFTPIYFENHWCLVYVNFVEKSVKYYGSLKGKSLQCLNIIFNYLRDEYENKKYKDFDCSGWQLMYPVDCPLQKNDYDCGVFVCVIAEYLARGAVLDFVQEDIPMLRQKVCYEILKNQFCY